ncbi:hypothetical protein [Pontibacter chitinilyticus]|uniref:hypothetical protein n=1 Tax=Pontibacter chitinilyticus TaxID=2674989 RepID=UPI003218F6F7
MMQVYFTNSFISLQYDKQAQLGKAVWRGSLRGPELREAFLLCLEMIDRFTLTRWLADDRLMLSIAPADLEWSMKLFVPRLAGSSILRFARLPSNSESNRRDVEFMIKKGQSPDLVVQLRDFATEAEAMDWLMELP